MRSRDHVRCPVCAQPFLPPEHPKLEHYTCPDCYKKSIEKGTSAVWLAVFKSKRCYPDLLPKCRPLEIEANLNSFASAQ